MAELHNSKTNVKRIQLCGVQGCCPTVEVYHGSDKIVITDDDGGKVTLTKKQLREAVAKVTMDA